MKTMIKVIAIATLAVILCVALVSCGVPSGKYTGLGGARSYEFKGNKVTVSQYALLGTIVTEATYKVKDGKITFTYKDDSDSADLEREATYEKTDDGIKINGVEYKKEK